MLLPEAGDCIVPGSLWITVILLITIQKEMVVEYVFLLQLCKAVSFVTTQQEMQEAEPVAFLVQAIQTVISLRIRPTTRVPSLIIRHA